MLTHVEAVGAPPWYIRNRQLVYLSSLMPGATAHLHPECPRLASPRLVTTAVQAWIWGRVSWCPVCRELVRP